MIFFTGMHKARGAQFVERAFISVNALRDRKAPFVVGEWVMDSGAFTEIATHGRYRHTVAEYAAQIKRWAGNGRMLAAVAQDFMCEPWIVAKTGLSVEEHQRLTIARYDDLVACDVGGAYILPVLQGYAPESYVDHVRAYGARLAPGAWVGVGSVCKRNADPGAIAAVLGAIKRERPDLRLHGFGLKLTALGSPNVVGMLYSADSMAWSYAARRQGRDGNSYEEAARFGARIESLRSAIVDYADRQGAFAL